MLDNKISLIIYLELEPEKDKALKESPLQCIVFWDTPGPQVEQSVPQMAHKGSQASQKETPHWKHLL